MNSTNLEKAASAVLAREEMELVELVLGRHGNKTLVRFFIDRIDGKAVTLEDCERLSRQIEAMIDMDGLINGAYVLEVSSPGVDRPLKTPEHFKRFVGTRAKIHTKAPTDNGHNFVHGVIKSSSADGIVVEENGKDIAIKFDNVRQARLDPELEF